jgi:hypothetical protein
MLTLPSLLPISLHSIDNELLDELLALAIVENKHTHSKINERLKEKTRCI